MPGAISFTHCSLLLGDDLNLLLDGEASLLSVDHNLEALEVGEVGASVSLCELLGNGGLGPLGGEVHFLGGLHEGASAGTTLNGDHHFGERESLEGHHHAGEVLSVDEHAVAVCDVNDSRLA